MFKKSVMLAPVVLSSVGLYYLNIVDVGIVTLGVCMSYMHLFCPIAKRCNASLRVQYPLCPQYSNDLRPFEIMPHSYVLRELICMELPMIPFW